MNCDHAFDCLTDATRRESAELVAHLAQCPRCRDMAEALEPALDLLSETATALTEPADAFALPIVESHEPRRRTPAHIERRVAPTEMPSDAAWPNAPWHSEAQRRLQRRLVTWQLLAGIAGLTCVLAALTLLQRSDQQALAALRQNRDCQRAEPTTASASTVVAGCVACHTLEETLQLIAESNRQPAQATVTRCVACHLESPKKVTTTPEQFAQPQRLLLACEFPQIGG